MQITTVASSKKIADVRQALLDAGYKFSGYGAMTSAETYKLGDSVAFIRRRNGLVTAEVIS